VAACLPVGWIDVRMSHGSGFLIPTQIYRNDKQGVAKLNPDEIFFNVAI